MNEFARSSRAKRFDAAMDELPLVAILRGITPAEAPTVGATLVAEGFRLIEVPLNSPQPFDSIAALRAALSPNVLVGAGTVLTPDDVRRLRDGDADLVVMPHADTRLIREAKAAGLLCVPGVATPTEAFAALDAGADALKLFPAELVSPAVVKALRAVLPASVRLLPVGGITASSMPAWSTAGISGFGLGSALYAPGRSADEVRGRARAFVTAWRALSAGS
jgi:2-dehydro-3-deoxyphosphogalactonate aldolase